MMMFLLTVSDDEAIWFT